MTPPLTRETLAELRRLLEAERQASMEYVEAAFNAGNEVNAELYAKQAAAEARFCIELRRHLDALLAAAERGLDVEGGR